MLDDGAEGEGGQEIERADEQHGGDEQDGEGGAIHGEGAGAGRALHPELTGQLSKANLSL